MLLESAFHSKWLLFLRVMQENKRGCFFFRTKCIYSGAQIYCVETEYEKKRINQATLSIVHGCMLVSLLPSSMSLLHELILC